MMGVSMLDFSVPDLSRLDLSAVFILFATLCGFIIPALILFPPIPPSTADALRETHSKLDDIPSRGQGKKGVTHNSTDPGEQVPRLRSLHIYPVKSCRGIELTKSKVIPSGLEFDRLFTFAYLKGSRVAASGEVEEKDDERGPRPWEFVTQRQYPLLATLAVDLWIPDPNKTRGSLERTTDEAFVLIRFPWRQSGIGGLLGWVAAKLERGLRALPEKEILLPVEFPSKGDIKAYGYTYEEVRIWKDTAVALNMGRELPPELPQYLGVSDTTRLALFRADPENPREVYRCAPRSGEAGYQPVVDFQDSFPLHLVNLSSVQELQSNIPNQVLDMKELRPDRFRANIIISNAPAYDEEAWKCIKFQQGTASIDSDGTYHVSCRCVRCKMPNVDQVNGIRHVSEPDNILRKHRAVDAGAPGKGCMGMLLTPLFADTTNRQEMETWLEVGMTIDVLERGEHLWLK